MDPFNHLIVRHQELKAEGKTDEDIYAELKTLYNNSAGTTGEPPGAVANGGAEKAASATDTTADTPATQAEPTSPAGESPAEVPAVADAAGTPAEAEVAPTAVAAETPAPEGAAPPEAAATAE